MISLTLHPTTHLRTLVITPFSLSLRLLSLLQFPVSQRSDSLFLSPKPLLGLTHFFLCFFMSPRCWILWLFCWGNWRFLGILMAECPLSPFSHSWYSLLFLCTLFGSWVLFLLLWLSPECLVAYQNICMDLFMLVCYQMVYFFILNISLLLCFWEELGVQCGVFLEAFVVYWLQKIFHSSQKTKTHKG